jgi:hypothetical protein
MSYYDQLDRALSFAPTELWSDGGGMAQPDGTVVYSNRMDHTQRLPDHAKLKSNFNDNIPLNAVAVTYPEDFSNLLHAAVEIVGVKNYDIAKAVIHEEGHAEVLRLRDIGATSCRFEVLMLKLAHTQSDLQAGRVEICFMPQATASNITAPKIILAGMNARPVDPSDNDMAAIKSYGYRDVQDVGDRLIRYSQRRWRSVKPVLLPLSYIEPK